jgi:hypothetical protein
MLTTFAVFPILSLIVESSDICIFILLCLQSAAYHASSFSVLSLFYFLFVTPKIYLLDWLLLLPNPPISFISSHACG